MNSIPVLAIALILFLALGLLVALGSGLRPGKAALYQRRRHFLSAAERSFFGVLSQAAGDRATVLAKVRIADVIAPRSGLKGADRQRAFNRISAKHFDFLLCDPATLEPLAAVELDDRSHRGKAAAKRDAIKDEACESAQLPLVRFTAKRGYALPEIKEQLAGVLPEAPATTPPRPTAKAPQPPSPSCPKCSAGMTLRVSRKGPRAGQRFWGCETFPACRGVRLATAD